MKMMVHDVLGISDILGGFDLNVRSIVEMVVTHIIKMCQVEHFRPAEQLDIM